MRAALLIAVLGCLPLIFAFGPAHPPRHPHLARPGPYPAYPAGPGGPSLHRPAVLHAKAEVVLPDLPSKKDKPEPEVPVVELPRSTGVKTAVTAPLIAPAINLEAEYLPTKLHTETLAPDVRPVEERIITHVIQPINREIIKPVSTTLEQPIIREVHPVHETIVQPVVTTTIRTAPSAQIVPVHSNTQVDTVYVTRTEAPQEGPTVVGAPLPAAPPQQVGDFSTPTKV